MEYPIIIGNLQDPVFDEMMSDLQIIVTKRREELKQYYYHVVLATEDTKQYRMFLLDARAPEGQQIFGSIIMPKEIILLEKQVKGNYQDMLKELVNNIIKEYEPA